MLHVALHSVAVHATLASMCVCQAECQHVISKRRHQQGNTCLVDFVANAVSVASMVSSDVSDVTCILLH